MYIGLIAWSQLDLLRKGGQRFNWKSWKYDLKALLGPHNGYITRWIKPYLQYYKPVSTRPSKTPAARKTWWAKPGFSN